MYSEWASYRIGLRNVSRDRYSSWYGLYLLFARTMSQLGQSPHTVCGERAEVFISQQWETRVSLEAGVSTEEGRLTNGGYRRWFRNFQQKRVWARVCLHMCVGARVCGCVRVCVCVRVWGGGGVGGINMDGRSRRGLDSDGSSLRYSNLNFPYILFQI